MASLETLAAQGEVSDQDDTAVRRLTRRKENDEMRAPAEALGVSRTKERTGRCPTAWVGQVGEGPLCGSDCGRAHAGEPRAALWAQRQADRDQPVGRSDALARHEVDAASVMRWHCLAPGRRPCSASAEVWPVECQGGLEVRTQGCAHDAEARAQQMRPEARWRPHQAARWPRMEALKRWRDRQRDERLVEPHSALGTAMASRQGHWTPRTRWLAVAGAPLENHLGERALQRFIRQRTTARCSRTAYRASSARGLTRLIAPCLQAGVQAVEDLVALPEHCREVLAEPAAGWPWSYPSSRASPEATRRPAGAIWAPAGLPCHTTMSRARAARGPGRPGAWATRRSGPATSASGAAQSPGRRHRAG